MAACKVLGVEILNEGTGMSIEDAVNEMTCSYVARAVEPLSVVASPFGGALVS